MTRYEGEEKMKAPDIETISQELEDAILQMENRNERITSVVGPEPEPAVEESAGGTKIRRQPGKKRVSFLPAGERQKKYRREQRAGFQMGKAGYLDEGLIKPGDAYAAAFLIPVLVMIIIFIQRGIFPFGEESFLRTDMYHQYAPFFSEFQYKLKNGGSLLYSWDVGLGVNFAALYAYYLASPFNWLLILCPKSLIIEFMTYLIVIKIGLAGLSQTYYLRKHFNCQSFGAAFFGIFYALSGYMAAYSWNIMWLDCIVLFPLILLGLERLVKQGRWGMYCICLGLSILSNYYISIMICIYMVLYFIALLIMEKRKTLKEYGKTFLRFCLSSLGAGGFAAAVLVPEVMALQSTASGSSTFPKTFSSYFSIIDMISRHMGNVEVEIGLDHWPNIYCGVAVLIFFLLYLVCRKISVREKVVCCSLLLFFYLSFSVNVLNFIWHGFHYPNSLPCRQSFIYICLLLTMCFHAYRKLDSIPWKHRILAFWGAVAFVLIAEQTVTDDAFHFIVFYVAVFFLALYAGLMYLHQKGVNRNVLVLLALGLVSVEAAINTTVTSVTTTSRTAYTQDNDDVRELVENGIPKNTFYRVEKISRKTKNDGAWMNFPSVSLFSSVANADLSDWFRQMGCESSTNAYSITGSTPLVNSLLSVRYALYSEIPHESSLLTFLAESGETYLYENAYTLPLGFMLPELLESEFYTDSGTPAEVQNQLASFLGCSPVLTDAWGEVNSQSFRFTPDRDGEYYVYVINKAIEEVTVNTGEESRTFEHVNRGYFLELGWLPAGQEVLVTCSGDEILDARAYRFEEDALGEVYEALKDGGLTVTRWQDTRIEGTVQAAEAGTMFTSIPYDEGWTVLVDGSPVTGRKVLNAFLGFDVPQGAHSVTLTYFPPGLTAGLILSGASILCIGAAFGVSHFYRKKSGAYDGADGYDETAASDEGWLDEDLDTDLDIDLDFGLDEDFGYEAYPDEEIPSDLDRKSERRTER